MFEVGKFLPINGIGEVFREVFTYLPGLEKFLGSFYLLTGTGEVFGKFLWWRCFKVRRAKFSQRPMTRRQVHASMMRRHACFFQRRVNDNKKKPSLIVALLHDSTARWSTTESLYSTVCERSISTTTNRTRTTTFSKRNLYQLQQVVSNLISLFRNK